MFPRCTYIIAPLVVLLTVNVPFKWTREWQFVFDEIKAVPVSNGINWCTYLDKPFTIRRSRQPKQNFRASKTKILVSFHSNNKTKTIEWPYLWIVACCYPIFQFFLVQYLIILLSIDLARKLAEKNYFASIFHSKEYKMVCVNWYQN